MIKNGRLYPGMPFRVTITFTDEDGVLTDPTTVTIKVMDPCGGETTYVEGTDSEMDNPSTGVYTADITPDCAGRWSFRWITTGPVFADEGDFIVLTSPFVDNCSRVYV
jgi:hypothetical protein